MTAATSGVSTKRWAMRLAVSPLPSSSSKRICSGLPARSGRALICDWASSMPRRFIAPYPSFQGPAAPKVREPLEPPEQLASRIRDSRRFMDLVRETGARNAASRCATDHDELKCTRATNRARAGTLSANHILLAKSQLEFVEQKCEFSSRVGAEWSAWAR